MEPMQAMPMNRSVPMAPTADHVHPARPRAARFAARDELASLGGRPSDVPEIHWAPGAELRRGTPVMWRVPVTVALRARERVCSRPPREYWRGLRERGPGAALQC